MKKWICSAAFVITLVCLFSLSSGIQAENAADTNENSVSETVYDGIETNRPIEENIDSPSEEILEEPNDSNNLPEEETEDDDDSIPIQQDESVEEAVYETDSIISFSLYQPQLVQKTGRVYDFADGDGIKNVQIKFFCQETGEEFFTNTDNEGFYSIDLPVGTYEVILTRNGFETGEYQMIVSLKDDNEERPVR